MANEGLISDISYLETRTRNHDHPRMIANPGAALRERATPAPAGYHRCKGCGGMILKSIPCVACEALNGSTGR